MDTQLQTKINRMLEINMQIGALAGELTWRNGTAKMAMEASEKITKLALELEALRNEIGLAKNGLY